MFFEDETSYTYFPSSANHTVLNIGWLDRAVEFPTAPPDEMLLRLLKMYLPFRVQLTRGHHTCNLKNCIHQKDHRKRPHGSSEIWVISNSGVVYACPELIIHYIEDHSYLPPSAFISSVIHGLPSGGVEYSAALRLALGAG